MSTFSVNEFYQRNRRIVIWAILFGLLWLLRDFFAVVFLSFVLAFIAAPLAEFGTQRLRLPHWFALSTVYVAFLAVLVSFVWFVVPSVAAETNRVIDRLPETELRLIEAKNRIVTQYPALREPFTGFMRSALDVRELPEVDRKLVRERERLGLSEQEVAESLTSTFAPAGTLAEYLNRQDQIYVSALVAGLFERVRDQAPAIINALYMAIATILLALLFSFLVLIDLGRIKRGIGRLQNSRVGDFYREAAPPIVRCASLVGRAIEAQALIAGTNTILTLIGLLILGLPSITMLSVIVFACSFIPVLGVFISTTPIVLVALNSGGLTLSLAAIALIVVIHAIEAYLLNPIIYGRHLRLNPVLTLVILYVGYHAFGLWGMLLGVPVARYVIHDVFGVPFRDRRQAVRQKGDLPAPAGPDEPAAD